MEKDRKREKKQSRVNFSNIKKAYYYFKRNGLKAASFAVMERLGKNGHDEYHYEELKEDVIKKQKDTVFEHPVTFSILVPAYQTKKEYLRALLMSLEEQTYPYWELILADAGKDDGVFTETEEFCRKFKEQRIHYHRLPENRGISGNTNKALAFATGDYIGLLDHDDILTPDALFENAVKISDAGRKGTVPEILYSDEDKCDETGTNYYEVNYKPDFNLDLLLSNNYICHFLVMRRELMQKLQFRCNFDGSQDYDLILRGVGEVLPHEEKICHIPRVLYHWRCHQESTAANPQSKGYAYEAGKNALENFILEQGWNAKVMYGMHWGFYRIIYEPDIFAVRKDVGVVGGVICDKKRRHVVSGLLDPDGICPYRGLRLGFSGYMHRASLMQEAYAVDIRCAEICDQLKPLMKQAEQQVEDPVKRSIRFCEEARKQGYRILWNPGLQKTLSDEAR